MRNLIGGTDPGLVRASNQDCYETVCISDTLAFAVLCDGMGGENGGNIASAIACNHAKESLLRDLVEDMSEGAFRGVMKSVIVGANALVYDAALKDASLTGMGTTMVVAVLSQRNLYVAYVGDSRVYLSSPSGDRQLSRDHTVVQMLVDIGEITEADARVHPQRHYITRAVGVAPNVDVDFLAEVLETSDLVMLCSDGLYNYMEPTSYYELFCNCLKAKSVQTLIDLAKGAGGADNITAVVMQ